MRLQQCAGNQCSVVYEVQVGVTQEIGRCGRDVAMQWRKCRYLMSLQQSEPALACTCETSASRDCNSDIN